MLTGSWGLIEASDGVYAGHLDGVWDRDVDTRIEGRGLFKCKIQVSGNSRYLYSDRLEDDFSGASLLYLNIRSR